MYPRLIFIFQFVYFSSEQLSQFSAKIQQKLMKTLKSRMSTGNTFSSIAAGYEIFAYILQTCFLRPVLDKNSPSYN